MNKKSSENCAITKPLTSSKIKSTQLERINPLVVDWEKAEDHLQKLGRSGDLVLCVFPSKNGNRKNFHFKCTTDKIPRKEIEQILKKNTYHSLGFVVNPPLIEPSDWTGEKVFGASNTHISHSDCLFLEGDSGIDLDRQYSAVRKAGLPKPSMTIFTGGKSVHFYWFLKTRISPKEFSVMMKRIAEKVDSEAPELGVDMGLCNPCRVMRISGGFHGTTKNRCELRSFSGEKYDLDTFEKVLPQVSKQPQESSLNDSRSDNGWFSRRPPTEQHLLAVEMATFLPKRNEMGRGEYPINISALYGLKGHFGGKEAAQICKEANWSGAFWDPLKELPTLDSPTNSIGTFITHARQFGWEFKEDVQQESKLNIKLEDLFPPEIVEPLRIVTKFLPYPDTLIATTYLAGCSGLLKLGSSINLNPLSDFIVPLNLYVITVGKTGTKKTPLHKALIDGPIEKLKAQAKAEYQEKISNWSKQNPEEREKKPIQTYLVVKNITEEALEVVLQNQERLGLGLLYSRDEVAGIFAHDKYKRNKGSEQEQLLELYDGNGFDTIRKAETRSCDQTHLSLYGGIQPQILAELQGSSDHTGKWGRCIFSELPANPTKLAVRITKDEKKAFAAAKEKLTSLAKNIRRFSGYQYELDDSAVRLFSEFEYKKQEEGEASKRPSHAAILNKTAGKVGRIAGLLHHLQLITNSSDVDDPVGVESLKKAIALVEYLDDFAMQFQTENTRSEKQRWMKRLHTLASKSKSKQMTWTEMRGKLNGKERTTLTQEMRKEVLEQLQEANFGALKEGPQGGLIYQVFGDWPKDA